MAGKPISLPALRNPRLRWALLVIVLLTTPYVIAQLVAGFAIPRNTMVGVVRVGGLTAEAARDVLAREFPDNGVIDVTIKDRTYEVDVADTSVRVDPAATVDLIASERWNPLALLGMLLGTPREPVIRYDDARLTATVTGLARETDVPARNADVDLRTLTVVGAKRGAGLDIEHSKELILRTLADGKRSVTLVRERRNAVVSTLVAERALRDVAIPAVSESVTVLLTLPDGSRRESRITRDTIRAALDFVPVGSLLEPQLDGDVLRRDVDRAVFDVQEPAVDATFTTDGESVTVVPSRDGFGVTSESLASDVLKVLRASGAQRSVELALGTIPADFTTAEAQALNIKERVSWYRQRFPAATYRTINIGTAAKRINGTLLMPGEVFSMNDTVKERTEDNGYTEGWIIGPDGVFRNELGGAVSTITTAMFNAAWFAGVELVEHRAHSIYMSRYPAGREATVSWGSLDMKFRNTLSNPIYITTELRRTSITVSFWGTKEYDEVDSVFGPWENKQPYPELTGVLPDCHKQDGVPGFQITVWRVLYKNGEEVRREPYRTRYRPSPHVVCKKPPKPVPTPTAAPSPTPTATPTPTETPAG